MDALQLTMSLSGGSVDSGLTMLAERLKDLSAPLEAFGRVMMVSVARNFDEQGRPDRWKPLAESTIKRKGGDTILVNTGRLRGSIGFKSGSRTLTLYAGTPYALVHQHGGVAGRDGRAAMPARPFIVFQDEDVARLKNMLTSHIVNQN